MRNKRHIAGFDLIEALIVMTIIGIIIAMVYGSYYENTVEMPKAYKAWVKATGNTNDLTFEEWKSLVRAGEKSSPVFYPIFIPSR